jgi:membrane protein implicated in regulation of membrane protease activity
MDAIQTMFESLTLWHWVGLGVVLLTLEVAIGTFDLLWVALGAFLAALFVLIMPAPIDGWQGQLVFFGVSAVVFVAAGRTVFKGLRQAPATHPNLNARTSAMVGQTGDAVTMFEHKNGKVKVGDTVWLAKQIDDTVIVEGDDVVVTGSEGTTLLVRLA